MYSALIVRTKRRTQWHVYIIQYLYEQFKLLGKRTPISKHNYRRKIYSNSPLARHETCNSFPLKLLNFQLVVLSRLTRSECQCQCQRQHYKQATKTTTEGIWIHLAFRMIEFYWSIGSIKHLIAKVQSEYFGSSMYAHTYKCICECSLHFVCLVHLQDDLIHFFLTLSFCWILHKFRIRQTKETCRKKAIQKIICRI